MTSVDHSLSELPGLEVKVSWVESEKVQKLAIWDLLYFTDIILWFLQIDRGIGRKGRVGVVSLPESSWLNGDS